MRDFTGILPPIMGINGKEKWKVKWEGGSRIWGLGLGCRVEGLVVFVVKGLGTL